MRDGGHIIHATAFASCNVFAWQAANHHDFWFWLLWVFFAVLTADRWLAGARGWE